MTNVQRVEIDGHNPPTYLCRTVQPEQMLQSDVSRKCLEVVVGNYFNEGIREIVLGYDSAFVIFGKTGRFNWSVAPDWSWWNETMKRPGVKVSSWGWSRGGWTCPNVDDAFGRPPFSALTNPAAHSSSSQTGHGPDSSLRSGMIPLRRRRVLAQCARLPPEATTLIEV